MPRKPLEDAPQSEVLARVAYQLVKVEYRKPRAKEAPPTAIVFRALRQLPPNGFGQLRFALHSLNAHLGLGIRTADWLAGVIERSSYGGVFRWHFFAGYKANRRPYPPVSNTGVQNGDGVLSAEQLGFDYA